MNYKKSWKGIKIQFCKTDSCAILLYGTSSHRNDLLKALYT